MACQGKDQIAENQPEFHKNASKSFMESWLWRKYDLTNKELELYKDFKRHFVT